MLKLFTTFNEAKGRYEFNQTGIIAVVVIIVALIGVALLLRPGKDRTMKMTTMQLAFSGVALALAMVTSMIKVPGMSMPMGGSVTLFSMFFVVLIGYFYGPGVGLMAGFAYGLMQFLIKPVFYTVPQMIVDYPLAFGALGLSGFFNKQKYGLQIGYFVGITGRFVFAFLSGLLFFAEYAEGSGISPFVYSAAYNAQYIYTEGVVTLIILFGPQIVNAIRHVRKLATEKQGN